jgi:hypothetical protein
VNATLLRKAWTDSVWSKVIAAGITALLASLLGALAAWWRTLEGLRESIFRLVDRPVTLPAWSLLALGGSIALQLWLMRRNRRPGAEMAVMSDALQPNAVPVLEARYARRIKKPAGREHGGQVDRSSRS